MLKRIVILTIASVLVALPAVASPLDGKTFVGHIKKTGDSKEDPDTISFSTGRFHSTGSDRYGFKPSAYKAVQVGEFWSFTTAATSATEGLMSWKGTVKGSSISGKAVWNKNGQAPIEYTFFATLK